MSGSAAAGEAKESGVNAGAKVDFGHASYGVGSRLKTGPSAELQGFFQDTYLDQVDAAAFSWSIDINLAHVLMLAEKDIVPADAAKPLLGVLMDLHRAGREAFTFDPVIGDSLPNLENHVIRTLGDRVGGMLHTGRSRGDYYATLSRMKIRQRLLDLAAATLTFRQVLMDLASRHTGSVMPGYTHMQHAQPITLGYYLCAFVHELERDFTRIVDAFERMNLSPLGLGIISTSPYPLDRARTAQLLGFRGQLRNGRDLTDRDYALEGASSAAIVMMHLHKLATDLYEWATAEFALIRVDDSDAMTSSMMPQKANPVLLEDIRARTAFAIGDLVSVFAVTKGSAANNIEQTDGDIPALDALYRTKAALVIFARSLPRIAFDTARMKLLASRHWSQATDLADAIVQHTELSFREAHRVVGALVAASIAANRLPEAVTTAHLEAAARSVLKEPVDLTGIDLSDALDAARAIDRRQVAGGPAPRLVEIAVTEARAQLKADLDALAATQGRLDAATRLLHDEARARSTA
jgi:argininosuccinate lyase